MFKKGSILKSKKVFIATMLVMLSALAFELAPIFTHQTAQVGLPRHEEAALSEKETQLQPVLQTNVAPEVQAEPEISAKSKGATENSHRKDSATTKKLVFEKSLESISPALEAKPEEKSFAQNNLKPTLPHEEHSETQENPTLASGPISAEATRVTRSLAEVESAPPAPLADTKPAVQVKEVVTQSKAEPPQETLPEVQKENQVSETKESDPQSLVVKDFWIWAGTGVDFTNYSQTVPGFSTVSFGKIKSPTQVFHAGFLFDDRFGLDLGYKNIPGEAEAGSSISVQNGSYEWKTLSAEVLYRPSTFEAAPRKSEWIWRLGVQQHEMPFIVPLTANSIKTSSNNMTTLSLGVEYRKLTKKNIRIETMLRYQQPIASSSEVGSSFSLSSPLIFDGSVGAAYELKSNIYIGTYWHGQYQSNTFSYTNNSTSYSGNQSLFNSNFDLRLGVEF